MQVGGTELNALRTAVNPGLKALLEVSQLGGKPLTSGEVAFRIAPRINAAGRMDTAERALALFEERDSKKAAAIARALSIANAQRQSIERRVVGEARDRIARSFDSDRDAVIVEAAEGWHRGWISANPKYTVRGDCGVLT